MILKWPEVVAVVLVLTLSLGGGQGPTPELWFCLWLSFIQITESCIWEPWMGSPAIPKLGKIGTQQDSRCYLALFACRIASGSDIGLVLCAGLVPHSSWVLALWSLFAAVWIDLPFLDERNFCSCKAILRFLSQKTQRLFEYLYINCIGLPLSSRPWNCPYFVSWIWDNFAHHYVLN